jgi:heme oxygenase
MTPSQRIKTDTLDLHKEVERLNPMGVLLHTPFDSSGEAALTLFSTCLTPLWQSLGADYQFPEGYEQLTLARQDLYPSTEPFFFRGMDCHWLGNAYVLLGSSMGASFIYKNLSEKGYTNLHYFQRTRSLAALFLRAKEEIDALSEIEYLNFRSAVNAAYATLIRQFEKKQPPTKTIPHHDGKEMARERL